MTRIRVLSDNKEYDTIRENDKSLTVVIGTTETKFYRTEVGDKFNYVLKESIEHSEEMPRDEDKIEITEGTTGTPIADALQELERIVDDEEESDSNDDVEESVG